MQPIHGMEGLQVCIGLYLVHDDKCVDSKRTTSVIVIEGLFLHVALPNVGCIICNLTEESATDVGPLASWFTDNVIVKICLKLLSSADFTNLMPKMYHWKVAKDDLGGEAIPETGTELNKRKTKRNWKRKKDRESGVNPRRFGTNARRIWAKKK